MTSGPRPTPQPSPPGLLLRVSRQSDVEVLFAIHCEVMRGYIEQATGTWDEAAERTRYLAGFPVGRAQVILVGYEIAGTIDVQRHPDRWTLNTIEVAPEWQNQGIGTILVDRILKQAHDRGVPVDLEVLHVNHAARRLYTRLGFTVTGETATHAQMRAE